jgi:Ca-activated chloride channel family protein
MLQQFHFLQPLWLLALFPLMLLLWLAFRPSSDSKAWEKVIDPNLLPLLLHGEDKRAGKLAKILLAIGWFITVIALADPVWEKVPRPVFQTNSARVIVLDLSNSMLADDLKPNRLARARFKIEDILSREEEGQTGLVLFAGDAFTASPLTRDTNTIRSMLKILSPQLMPVQGSRADLGLRKAHDLLKQAGISHGQVLLIADGVSRTNAALGVAKELVKDGHSVSVLGVGTETGGELNFRNNQSVIVKLETEALRKIASAGVGAYHLISTNNADLQSVLANKTNTQAASESDMVLQDIKSEEWKSSGPLLILLLLPLAALAFRRGWLFNIFFGFVLIGFTVQPQTAMASQLDTPWQNLWQSLTHNKEQRADIALQQQQYDKASELSNDPLRLGSAYYKQKKYPEALESFKQAKGADARYNEGNTLAQLKRYEEAIVAYDEALKLQEGMKDAIENKKAIEALLKKKQEKEKASKDSASRENKQKKSDNQQQKDQQNSDQKNSKDNGNSQQAGQKSEKNKEQQQGEDNQSEGQQAKQSDQNDTEQQDQKQASAGQSDEKPDQKKDQGKDKDQTNQFSDATQSLDDKKEQQTESDAGNDSEQQVKNKVENNSEGKATEKDTTAQKENDDNNPVTEIDTTKKRLEGSKKEADELTKEEKMAAEQWLRRIPDDPGGLLRRKFQSQYRQRQRTPGDNEQPW